MPKAYSLDLRERILNDYDSGVPVEDIVAHYVVSRSWTYSLLKQRRETGIITPKVSRRGPKLKLAPYEKEVRQLVTDHPDATLEELHAMLPNKDEVTVVTLHNFLVRLKITWKKDSPCCRTTSRRCCRRTRRMEEVARDFRHKKACFH
jgi:transposase